MAKDERNLNDRQSAATKLAGVNLRLAYGPHSVVEGLDIALPARRFTALIGPNGSGKSTILRSLAGLMRPAGGTVLLDGRGIATLSTRALARQIGVLLQGPVAPEGLTVGDLVAQGRYPHRGLLSGWSPQDQAACDEALRLTGTGHLADRALDSLSGGQRQRAWIAMTLAQRSEVILLDEPTTYLDLEHQIELMNLIRTLVRDHGKTVVAVLHDINQAARYADHIVLLKAGRRVASGPPAQVISARAIEEVFQVRSMIIEDPVAGTPLCIPLAHESERDRRPSPQET
ncbi:ABC transporter [Rhizobium rhizosphaerae]|uniref:ABC transporter n=1 Tax=Xaviernesmea rhizosphaerae TaxID=1672749 RepID=A0ABX3PH38_9HYPH|nr:ABC transporter ATP-binding protein [Xaviernesmea rhizosphaerae]OQP87442.1 ABC transporter [Xaviernesmea rhizosphaerae]